jgi:hypothetical protein
VLPGPTSATVSTDSLGLLAHGHGSEAELWISSAETEIGVDLKSKSLKRFCVLEEEGAHRGSAEMVDDKRMQGR